MTAESRSIIAFSKRTPPLRQQTGFENFIGRTMLDFAPRMEQFWFDLYGEVALTGEPRRVEHEAREPRPVLRRLRLSHR